MREVICCDFIRRTWKITTKESKRKPSKLQQKAVECILEVLPGTLILQEVALPIKQGKTLYLDIYLPTHNVGIEIMGAQHGKSRISFFHSVAQHKQQNKNDELKKRWCELNFIPLIYFWHNEKPEEWMEKLKKALGLTHRG